MKLENLVAVLAIGIPAINVIVPVLSNAINFFLGERKSQIEYERNNKLNSLTVFLDSVTDYCKNPNKNNKNVCLSTFSKLYFYYNIKDTSKFEYFFDDDDNIDFDELNRFVKSIKQ